MGARVYTAAGSGQVVSNDAEILVKSVLVTATSGNASATIKDGAGNPQIVVAAGANSSYRYVAVGGTPFYGAHIAGPVTVDVVGTGVFVRIDY